MITRFIDKIVESQVKNGVLEQSQVNIYSYGYFVMIEMLINIITGIVLGVLLNKVKGVFFFWFLFIPLRSFCGGWHAKKSLSCFLMSNLVLLLVLFLGEIKWLPGLGPELINIILILMLSPVDTKAKPLSEKEKKRYWNVVAILLGIHLVLWMWIALRKYIYYTHFIVCVSLLWQKIRK